ncbi:serine hydrolase domain-containing protein [Catenuloplanes atrovinosus]|uniref:D-alanyl-D-alanine carboxypeptidase n=1 Tax=Catenuloplanes atrovinosus TaxID=137266 RepID=A0AAE3YMI3_9ACTN|nr:serine hydrolase domain-containing protein [Catenuloplanes atrovinosus]MDR7276488.1 D-alanyl-D-alanine carboxypeptidase [Catenuloplanes atrovinosus]
MTTNTNITNRTARSLRGAAIVLTATAALAGSGTAALAGDAGHDRVMRDVARSVLSVGVPGYVARVDDGRRVAVTTAGVADRATGRPITARDQFEIGSNTKTFVAVLVLQLVDRGQVELDAPVERYLPGIVANGENITVRMLLNHTSGLFSYTSDPEFFSRMEQDPQHVFTEEELLAIAFAHEPNFAPGQGWSYSNTNYTLLGMILEELTGTRMPDLVRQRITGPLGLRNTYYADPYATNTGRGYAHGYAISYAGGTPEYVDVSDRPLGGWAGAAGAIISTPDDLSRFMSAVLSGKLLSRAQLAEMKTTVELPAEFPIDGGYGLGLLRIDSPCGTVWGHGGDTLGHHSTAVTTADGRRTAVTDSTGEPAELEPNEGANRYVRVVMAADTVTICRMLGKPAPESVLADLHS